MKRKRCVSNFFEPWAVGRALAGPVFRPPVCSPPIKRRVCVEKVHPCDTWHDVNDPRCWGPPGHGRDCCCDPCCDQCSSSWGPGCGPGCGMPPPVPCFFEGVIQGEVCGVCECDAHLYRVVLYRLAVGRSFAVTTRRLDGCMRFRFDDLRCGQYMAALVCAREPRFLDTCHVEIDDCRPCASITLRA